jgi:phosphoribosylformylglycinamidine synthase
MKATVMTPASSAVVPEPASITPQLLAAHSITADEYARILAALGRVPSLTELGIYSVMWSEHCSYKSSRVHLKRLPTKSARVVQGPGENAAILEVPPAAAPHKGTVFFATFVRFLLF